MGKAFFDVVASVAVVLLLAHPAAGQRGASVETLWKDHCASCHGQRAEGDGRGTPTLLKAELWDPVHGDALDRRFFEAVREGLPGKSEHAFGSKLDSTEVWALVNHLREKQATELRKGRTRPTEGTYSTRHHAFRVETVIGRGLQIPWSVAFLPDGRLIVTERPGRVRIFDPASGTLSDAVEGIPMARHVGQGGMMEVALHPEYETEGNGWVYLAFADPREKKAPPEGPTMTRVVRGRLKEERADGRSRWRWVDEQSIFVARAEHYVDTQLHFGCRIAFQPSGTPGKHYLYFTIGERGLMDMAQDIGRPNGKVHRVWDDGRIPEDNPFVERRGAYESIWSYGHRNPQGLAFDLQGNLWDSEHGPRGGDELNLIRRGANYGWPIVSYGINYDGRPFHTPWADIVRKGMPESMPEITMPSMRWLPSIGACGLTLVRDGPRGEAFPRWRGDILAGGLSGMNVDRLRVRVTPEGKGEVIEREEILHGLGRVRDVRCAPDGSVYVVLNGPDKVVRLAPADQPR
jgi:glucose/arabinose dehydrogenase